MKLKKLLSMVLCLATLITVIPTTTAFAAAAEVDISINGTKTETVAANQTAQIVNIDKGSIFKSFELGVTGGSTTGELTLDPNVPYSGKVDAADVSVSVAGTALTWSITNAPEDAKMYLHIKTELVVTPPVQHTIVASSGDILLGGNTGSAITPTCTSEQTSPSVTEGTSCTVTFTPKTKNLITKLNIRTGDVLAVNLYDAVSQSIALDGVTYAIVKNSDGKVTVTIDAIKANTYITALTVEESKYALTVTNDGNCTSSINTSPLSSIKNTDFILTPKTGFYLNAIQITDSGYKSTLTQSNRSVKIGDRTYVAVWNADNSVTVTVPAATANVAVYATATKTARTYTVQSITMSGVTSNCSSQKTYGEWEKAEIILSPAADYAIDYVTISCGTETVNVSAGEGSFVLGGISHSINTDTRGTVTIRMSPGIGNIYVTDISISSTKCTVRVDTDRKVNSNVNNVTVSQGKSAAFTFTPDKNYHITSVTVTRNNQTYYADPSVDRYIEVNGVRCPISLSSSGIVSLTLNAIDRDMTVSVYTDYTGTVYDYVVSVSAGTGVSASNSKLTVTSGRSATVTFTPQNIYKIDRIEITRSGRTYTANPRDERTISVNGVNCPISVDSNGRVTVTLNNITADMSIYASAGYVKDGFLASPDRYSTITTDNTPTSGRNIVITVTADSGRTLDSVTVDDGTSSRKIENNTSSFSMNGRYYSINRRNDNVWTITVTMPKALTVLSTTSLKHGAVEYHTAYINGYKDGSFRPDNTITRSEIIAMLVRQYSGLTEGQLSGYASVCTYSDVKYSSWCAPYVGWAAGKGYLTCLTANQTLNPDKAITRAEFVSLIYAFEGAPESRVTSAFDDVKPSYWAKEAIDYATSHEWILGYASGEFRPESKISRAEVVAIVNRVFNRNYQNERVDVITGARSFSDVSMNYWAYYDILEASVSHQVVGVN